MSPNGIFVLKKTKNFNLNDQITINNNVNDKNNKNKNLNTKDLKCIRKQQN